MRMISTHPVEVLKILKCKLCAKCTVYNDYSTDF